MAWDRLKADLKILAERTDMTKEEKEAEAFKLGLVHSFSSWKQLDKNNKLRYGHEKEAKRLLD